MDQMSRSFTGMDFSPLLPSSWLLGLGGLLTALILFALWRRSRGALFRVLAGAFLLFSLAGPGLLSEEREPLGDMVLVLVDETSSMELDGRADRTGAALTQIKAQIGSLQGHPFDVRVERIKDDESGLFGTMGFAVMERALADVSPERVSGVVILSEGQFHDVPEGVAAPSYPVHLLSPGHAEEYDRRLVLERAPSFGLVDQNAQIRLRIEDKGDLPPSEREAGKLSIFSGGKLIRSDHVRSGRSHTINLPLTRGGETVFEVVTPVIDGELTGRNNRVIFAVQAARERLRVLLVSGEPHAGERAWRNLLKADPSVDLVHFTILRPPHKRAGVPVSELSLIPFPTRELFVQKLHEFDLVIFDRYVRRGVLAPAYLDNIRRYVLEGGAVLVAAGPAFAGSNSLYRSPLRDIMPATPTGSMTEQSYIPRLSETGTRHPVTFALEGAGDAGANPQWGPFLRHINVEPIKGDILMDGPQDSPLLILDRMGEGRVALLASDTVWLWSRGYQGGGPQAELLRRVAHWLMKEPELEEENLTGHAKGEELLIERRSVKDRQPKVTLQNPAGEVAEVPMIEAGPGLWRGKAPVSGLGLYQLADGELSNFVAVGPPAPREFEEPLSSFAPLKPLWSVRGSARYLEDGVPDVRLVGEGAATSGRGWIGLEKRGAYAVRGSSRAPLMPAWAALLVAACLLVLAWRIEGR